MKKSIYYDTYDVLITVLIKKSLEIINNHSQIIDEHILIELVVEKIKQMIIELIDWDVIRTSSDDPNDIIAKDIYN